jgi:hypothetical protein
MLDKLKTLRNTAMCAIADMRSGDHRWCSRGLAIAGLVVGWALGAHFC